MRIARVASYLSVFAVSAGLAAGFTFSDGALTPSSTQASADIAGEAAMYPCKGQAWPNFDHACLESMAKDSDARMPSRRLSFAVH